MWVLKRFTYKCSFKTSRQFFNTIQYVIKVDSVLTKLSGIAAICFYGFFIRSICNSGESISKEVQKIISEASGHKSVSKFVFEDSRKHFSSRFLGAIDSTSSHESENWAQALRFISIEQQIPLRFLGDRRILHYSSDSVWAEYVRGGNFNRPTKAAIIIKQHNKRLQQPLL